MGSVDLLVDRVFSMCYNASVSRSASALKAWFFQRRNAGEIGKRRCRSMYAVIRTGGKQYKVAVGDEVLVEKLDADVGAEVAFEVLMLCGEEGVQVGKPVVSGVTAKGEVVEHGKGKKVVVFKYKPKKNYRKKQGHRQPYTKVKINAIG